MPYAIDLIVRALPGVITAHYASLGQAERANFKLRLRQFLEKKTNHGISLTLWAAFLRQEWPSVYGDNGAPLLPLCCLPFSRQWYAVMRARVKGRQELWRRDDVSAQGLNDFVFAGERDDNGSTRLTKFLPEARHKRAGLCRKAEGRIGNRRERVGAVPSNGDGKDAA